MFEIPIWAKEGLAACAPVSDDGSGPWQQRFECARGTVTVTVDGAGQPCILDVRNGLGSLHRLDGPASVVRTNHVIDARWYRGGLLHREDGPARLVLSLDGQVILEEWLVGGIYHRSDGPARIWTNPEWDYYQENDIWDWTDLADWLQVTEDLPGHHLECTSFYWRGEEYWDHGLLHRLDGPAVISSDGPMPEDICAESWYRHGVLDREDGPAREFFYTQYEGAVETQEWYASGLRHREDGPAWISYVDGDGEVSSEQWWHLGRQSDQHIERHSRSVA